MPASKRKYTNDALKDLQAATDALRATVSLAKLSDTMRTVTAEEEIESSPVPTTVPVAETFATPDSSEAVEIHAPMEMPEVPESAEQNPADFPTPDLSGDEPSAADSDVRPAEPLPEGCYRDEKGRIRWLANDELSAKLQGLHDILVIGGYDPAHAARYPKLGYAISRYFESVEVLHREQRFRQMTGVGLTIEKILTELIETGITEKATLPSPESNYIPPPPAVLELLTLPRMGAKTVRTLYADFGVASLQDLLDAIEGGRVKEVKGLGPALKKALKARLAEDASVKETKSPQEGEDKMADEEQTNTGLAESGV